MTRAQGWIIIAELAILLYGLYYGAQQAEAKINSASGIVGSIESALFGQPAAATPAGATPII